MNHLTTLAARPAHRRYVLHTDKNIPSDIGWATAAEATAELRAHLAVRARNDRVDVDPNGCVWLNHEDRRILLEPLLDALPKRLTARQAADLVLIASARGRARYAADESVTAGVTRIPPAATERLLQRGWIEETDGTVGVSLAGIVALEWRFHKTEATPVAYWGDQIAETLVDVFAPED